MRGVRICRLRGDWRHTLGGPKVVFDGGVLVRCRDRRALDGLLGLFRRRLSLDGLDVGALPCRILFLFRSVIGRLARRYGTRRRGSGVGGSGLGSRYTSYRAPEADGRPN